MLEKATRAAVTAMMRQAVPAIPGPPEDPLAWTWGATGAEFDVSAVVRAVIEALMEPTPEMVDEGEQRLFLQSGSGELSGDTEALVAEIYRAMLQSILQSKEEGEGR